MEINLSNQGIYDFPREYCFQKDVISLMLENNNLTDLPKEIVNLKSLKKLNLSNNNINFNIHQKKWLEQLKGNGCLIYINNEDNVLKIVEKGIRKQTRYDTSVSAKNETNVKSSIVMEKVRVHEIADELGITSEILIDLAKKMGLEVRSTQSIMTMEQAESLAKYITNIESRQDSIAVKNEVPNKIQHVAFKDEIYDDNGFDKDWNHRITGTRYDENGFNKDWTIHKDTCLPKDRYGHRREFYKLKTVQKPQEKIKGNFQQKKEILKTLKIVNAKIPKQKGLKIVKKRFDDIEIDIPKIKSILPINDMHNERKIILIYTQEKDFLNLTLIEYYNNEFVVIDNIFKDAYGLYEITNIIQEFIYDEIEDEYGLSMSNLKTSNLNKTSFKDNKLKISEASLEVIDILKYEAVVEITIENLILEDNSCINLSFELTKNEFDDEIIDFRKNALDLVKKMIVSNNYTADNIDYIIGNEEALSISSIRDSLGLTFGKSVFPSSEKIINIDTVENKGTK